MSFIKKNMAIIISLLLAITAGIMVYVIINRSAPNAPVVIATQNLSVGHEITEKDITVKNMPIVAIPGSSFTDKNKVIGKTVVAGPLINGDMIRAEHLSIDSSLYATLQTMAPGWTAIELPPGAGLGLKGVRRGDKVHIYGETPSTGGLVVAALVENAVILGTPVEKSSESQYIVAIPSEYTPVIAEAVVRRKPLTIALPNPDIVEKTIVEEVPVEAPEETPAEPPETTE